MQNVFACQVSHTDIKRAVSLIEKPAAPKRPQIPRARGAHTHKHSPIHHHKHTSTPADNYKSKVCRPSSPPLLHFAHVQLSFIDEKRKSREMPAEHTRRVLKEE